MPDQESTVGFSLGFRIGQRWRVESSSLPVDCRGTTTLTRDVDVGDFRFTGGTVLRSDVSFRTVRVNAGWILLNLPQTEAGLVVGGRGVDLASNFRGTGQHLIDPSLPFQGTGTVDVGLLAVAGGFVSHALSPAWQVDGRFDVSLGGGALTDVEASVSWLPVRSVRLGLAYRYLDARLRTRLGLLSEVSRVLANHRVQGPQLTVEAAF